MTNLEDEEENIASTIWEFQFNKPHEKYIRIFKNEVAEVYQSQSLGTAIMELILYSTVNQFPHKFRDSVLILDPQIWQRIKSPNKPQFDDIAIENKDWILMVKTYYGHYALQLISLSNPTSIFLWDPMNPCESSQKEDFKTTRIFLSSLTGEAHTSQNTKCFIIQMPDQIGDTGCGYSLFWLLTNLADNFKQSFPKICYNQIPKQLYPPKNVTSQDIWKTSREQLIKLIDRSVLFTIFQNFLQYFEIFCNIFQIVCNVLL